SETVNTFGLDGMPLALQAKSTYVRGVSHGGHPCAEIKVAFSGTFASRMSASGGPAGGKLSGTLIYWFANDIGRETESDASMRIVITGAGSADGKTAAQTV